MVKFRPDLAFTNDTPYLTDTSYGVCFVDGVAMWLARWRFRLFSEVQWNQVPIDYWEGSTGMLIILPNRFMVILLGV